MKILGIETTCDDTGLAIYDKNTNRITYNQVITQTCHAQYGGVHVGLAPREHLSKLYSNFSNAGIDIKELDLIAYASHPGLLNCILIGACFARGLGCVTKTDTLGINHLHGHILSAWIESEQPQEDYLSILVSGGHSQIYHVKGIIFTKLSDTLDDALGELFDKSAKMLGLSYPGGPEIERLAKFGQPKYDTPIPLLRSTSLDFSFSGVKAHIRRLCNQVDLNQQQVKSDIAYSLQHAVVKILMHKINLALALYPQIKIISLVGGVSANQYLRDNLSYLLKQKGIHLHCANLKYCTDNAAMIAYAGYWIYKSGVRDTNVLLVSSNDQIVAS